MATIFPSQIQTNDDVTPDMAKMAVIMHRMMCRWNHNDGCSWYYEMGPKPGVVEDRNTMSYDRDDIEKLDDYHHNWSGSAHGEYLLRAIELLNNDISIEHANLMRYVMTNDYYRESRELVMRMRHNMDPRTYPNPHA